MNKIENDILDRLRGYKKLEDSNINTIDVDVVDQLKLNSKIAILGLSEEHINDLRNGKIAICNFRGVTVVLVTERGKYWLEQRFNMTEMPI